MCWKPLTERERRAWAIWGPVAVLVAILDTEEAHRSPDMARHGTLSEACRSIRRRVGRPAWALGWGSFALWYWRHTDQHDPQDTL